MTSFMNLLSLFFFSLHLRDGIILKYFNEQQTDVRLQGDCVEGYFSEMKAENNSIACTECKVCGDLAYELSPCGVDRDRTCFPDPVFYETLKDETKEEEDVDEGTTVEATSNVFYEDLLNVRNLETTYYVTDTTQASDFYWDRESGLRVNIGIHNVHLLPAYKDADHQLDSDNKFMNQSPDVVANQSFQAVTKSFCRYPVPDYYNLNLEVTPNRTSTTEKIQCSFENELCAGRHHQRALNSPCPESAIHLTYQQQHANSVVCVVESPLLSQVFKLRSGPDIPFGIHAKKCLLAHKKCNFCLESPRCRASLDTIEKHCCRSECLSSADCKFYYSNTCSQLMSSCATGPTYRYTIEPVYRSLEDEFRCHLVHDSQSILYELFVYVQVPSMNFQTKKITEQIFARDFEFNVRGKYKLHFLTIEHSSELEMAEDFMLAGRVNHQKKMEFVVYPASLNLTKASDHPVRYIKSNVWSTSMLPGKPFIYSTSTWNKETVADCFKDIVQMAALSSAPRIYHDLSDMFSLNESSFERVNVLIQNLGTHFSYHIKNSNSPPFFRFIVPANSSILSFYSHEFPGLLLKESLATSIEKLERHWSVSIKGKTSSCPTFFETEISDGSRVLPVIVRTDVLVLCPPKFGITFKVPIQRWDSSQKPSVTSFHLRVKDSKNIFEFFMTHVNNSFTHVNLDSAEKPNSSGRDDFEYSQVLIWVVFTAGVLLTISSFLCYVITLEAKGFVKYKKQTPKVSGCHICQASNHYSARAPCKVSAGFAEFLLLKTLYGVVFNFTAFFLALHFLVMYDAKKLNASVDREEMKMKLFFDKLMTNEEERMEADLKMFGNILACSGSATQTLRKAADEMVKVRKLEDQATRGSNALFIFGNKKVSEHLKQFNDSVTNYLQLRLQMFSQLFDLNVRDYFHFMHNKVVTNQWLASANEFFNLSKTFNCDLETIKILALYSLSIKKFPNRDLCYYQFIQLEEVDIIKTWYFNLKNKILKTPRLSTSVPAEAHEEDERPKDERVERLNTTKFVVVRHKTSSQFRRMSKQTIFGDGLFRNNNYEQIIIKDFPEVPVNIRQLGRSLVYVMETFDKMFLVQSTWIFCAVIDIVIFIYRINHSFANVLDRGSSRGLDVCRPFSSNSHHLRSRKSGNYCYWTFAKHENLKLCPTQNYISFATAAVNVDLKKVESQPFLAGSNHSGIVSVTTKVFFLVASSALRNHEISRILLSVGLIFFLGSIFHYLREVVEGAKLFSIQRFICDLPLNPATNFNFNFDTSFIISYLKHFERILEMDFANVQNFMDFVRSSKENLKQLLLEIDYENATKIFSKKFVVPCSVPDQNSKQATNSVLSIDCTEKDKSAREFSYLLRRIELFTSTFVLVWVIGHFVFKTFLCRLGTLPRRQSPFSDDINHSTTSGLQTFKSDDFQTIPRAFYYAGNQSHSEGGQTKERIYTETKV